MLRTSVLAVGDQVCPVDWRLGPAVHLRAYVGNRQEGRVHARVEGLGERTWTA